MSRKITLQKLKLMFYEYYSRTPSSIDTPHQIHMREFGMQTWEHNWFCFKRSLKDSSNKTVLDETGKPIMAGCGASGSTFSPISSCPRCGAEGVQINNWHRHLSYRTRDELIKALITKAPHSVYHSAAFYVVPVAKSMAAKEWQGAELVFDIDADHIDLPCAKEHDTWACAGVDENGAPCTASGKGKPPQFCPVCNGQKFNTQKWICKKCLETAKKHTKKLYDEFLVSDFDIDPANIQINYSGHRGYHIRVRDPNLFQLDDNARMEIVNYVMGLGILADRAIVTRSGVNLIPDRSMLGWYGKIADSLIDFVTNIDKFQGTQRWVKPLRAHKTDILEGLQRNRPILRSKLKGLGPKSWKEIALVAAEAYGCEIDKPVTTDLRRVIRLIGSLNGKTGLIVSEISRNEFDTFSPFRDSLAFTEGSLRVTFPPNRTSPVITIGDDTYGPYSDESVELPTAAAVFALCKGVATFE
ncbi:MAG: DNA primase small subunit domain-containing protein [Candidatus Thorarchaeota archaeon]|nr:MAG: hypothetical protein DRP09_04555 [Candidatus Thorarchaeota archaeon]